MLFLLNFSIYHLKFNNNYFQFRIGSGKNRRKSFGPARIDIAFVKLMSGARESIRNRRRNSSVSTNGFNGFEEQTAYHPRMPHTLEEAPEPDNDGFFSLKASSSQNSSSHLDLLAINGKRKSSNGMLKTTSSGNFFSKNASSSNLTNLNDSVDCENQGERKSLPEKVNLAATWVSAKFLKKHRERRARRMESEKSESSLNQSERLSDEDILNCRLSLNHVIGSEKCLRAFREFLAKEHSGENLEFWLASEEFHNSCEENKSQKALSIHEKFIKVRKQTISLRTFHE